MNRFKKAISVGMSAALLASLIATIAAPAAMASITGTSAGSVAQGATSTGTATILFTESSATALTALAPGCLQVSITPAAPVVGTVTWAGTPVVSAPGSLGATASLAGNILTVKITASDNANVETISISGLKVTASSDATPGAVVATLAACPTGTDIGPAFTGGTVTATGKLTTAVGVGSAGFTIALDTGSCPFAAAATVGSPLVIAGTNPETITSAAIAALAGGQQVVTAVTPVTAVNHLANDPITQAGVPGCVTVPSPATVVRALAYTSAGNPTVFPGENNSPAASLTLTEPALAPFGFLPVNTIVTYTIDTAGVVFSVVPTRTATGLVTDNPILSADRKSVTVTVTTVSVVPATIVLSGILYDVAATVAPGTFVSVAVTATGKVVLPATRTNAVVFRGITASAPLPTVYIGENNQATGLVTLKEAAAGFFQAGTGSNNVLSGLPDRRELRVHVRPGGASGRRRCRR